MGRENIDSKNIDQKNIDQKNIDPIEQQALERLLGPSTADFFPRAEHTQAQDFIAEKIQRAIAALHQDLAEKDIADADKILEILDDSYVTYLRCIHEAINSNALLSPSQMYFLDNLISVEEEIVSNEIDKWEHAAKVATYINSCRG
jgi:hypothetical protein